MYTYENFKELLSLLNEKLMNEKLEIEIYAIGGFAMMCNSQNLGFDAREISIDIDSYNEYNERIIELINETIKSLLDSFEVSQEYLKKVISENG